MPFFEFVRLPLHHLQLFGDEKLELNSLTVIGYTANKKKSRFSEACPYSASCTTRKDLCWRNQYIFGYVYEALCHSTTEIRVNVHQQLGPLHHLTLRQTQVCCVSQRDL
eukprot:Lithocolla_globosa_v1_NODE_10383_length_604_cov_1.624772.p1 type:complete len:109 gc:universal NODE_10383_length_604_cov_1.624772:247-573(+)